MALLHDYRPHNPRHKPVGFSEVRVLGSGFEEILNPQGIGFGGGCRPQNPRHQPVEYSGVGVWVPDLEEI